MPDEYASWSARHALLFGMNAPEDVVMLSEWCNLLFRAGYTATELLAATDWLSVHEPPRFRSDHPAALRACIDRQRLTRQGGASGMAPDLGECSLCQSCGMVSVPSLKVLQMGTWGTQAVLCPCAMGRWVRDRQGGDGPGGESRGPLMQLAEYERECPTWRTLMAQHANDAQRDLVAKHGRRTFPVMDDILNRILERMRDAKDSA